MTLFHALFFSNSKNFKPISSQRNSIDFIAFASSISRNLFPLFILRAIFRAPGNRFSSQRLSPCCPLSHAHNNNTNNNGKQRLSLFLPLIFTQPISLCSLPHNIRFLLQKNVRFFYLFIEPRTPHSLVLGFLYHIVSARRRKEEFSFFILLLLHAIVEVSIQCWSWRGGVERSKQIFVYA